jgi:hypothetical protein
MKVIAIIEMFEQADKSTRETAKVERPKIIFNHFINVYLAPEKDDQREREREIHKHP